MRRSDLLVEMISWRSRVTILIGFQPTILDGDVAMCLNEKGKDWSRPATIG